MTITRFAPSPTGWLHIGNLRAALFNWLIARKAKGQFILRLDDTDPERSTEEFAQGIQDDLRWLGLTWDRFERQSLRLARYAEAAEALKAAGRLYECFETPLELDLKRKKQLNMGKPPVYDRAALALSDGEKTRLRDERPSHWRFLLDQTRIEWTDGILGPISIDAASVSDPVLIRGDGQVLYTFASSVDDVDMGVTDIERGADHVTNSATQYQIMGSLGGTPPRLAHHSMLTGPQGEALSKRLGTLSLRDLRAQGVEPMAMLSMMARLGSSDPIEVRRSLTEIADGFELSHFGAAPTRFDPDDLGPLTGRVLASLDATDVGADLAGIPADIAPLFWHAVRGNLTKRADIADWWVTFRDGPADAVPPEDKDFVAQALALLPQGPFDATTWATWTEAVKAATGRKGRALYRPLRLALTGRDTGPEMAEVMPLLQRRPSPA